ncbi:MAG: hypothetical protein FWE11_09280 [Defluviitaleaceae bacterium]|nr:hypothetical protein [Defluviitaleaceae bacterium]
MFGTQWFETRILSTLRGTALPGTAQTFIGLYTTNPGNTGNAGSEISYSGYARQVIEWSAPEVDADGNIFIQNTNSIIFPRSQEDAGEVRHLGILNAQPAGSGNMMLYGEWLLPLQVFTDNQPVVRPGEVRYTLEGDFSRWFKTQILNNLRGETIQGMTPVIALFDGDPQDSGVELIGGGYQRMSITFAAPSAQPEGYTRMQNSNDVIFPDPETPWGTWRFTALMSSVTGDLVDIFQNPRAETINRQYIPRIAPFEYTMRLN